MKHSPQAKQQCHQSWSGALLFTKLAMRWPGPFDIAIVQTATVGNGSGGFVESDLRRDVIQTEEWLDKMIACALAGRVAEKLTFGDCALGSGGSDTSDLARATRLATDAEASLGFGQVQPLLYRSAEAQPSILSLDRQLAQRVNARLEAGEALATSLLSQERSALLALATRLAHAKTLDGGEVRALIGQEMKAATKASQE
jgi:ATP-dependent Zn protease